MVMTEPLQLNGLPRYAIGTLSPVGGIDTMPYGMYRLLGPDFIVISVSLALQSFRPEDLNRAVAAIEPQADHLVSRGADLILQSGAPLALSLGPKELERLLSRLRERCGVPVLSSALRGRGCAGARHTPARRRQQMERHHQPAARRLFSWLG